MRKSGVHIFEPDAMDPLPGLTVAGDDTLTVIPGGRVATGKEIHDQAQHSRIVRNNGPGFPTLR